MSTLTEPGFRVMLTMHIKPELADEFETVWEQVGDSVTSHPDNFGQTLARSEEQAGVYYIVSDWTDEASFRRFEHSQRHLDHRVKLHPYRSGGAMDTMTVVARLAPERRFDSHESWELA